MKDDKVKDALIKCAVGFETEEIIEEFAVLDGELSLVKKKVTRRGVPPDRKAVKMLLDDVDVGEMTDEQLEKEKRRLLLELQEQTKKKKGGRKNESVQT